MNKKCKLSKLQLNTLCQKYVWKNIFENDKRSINDLSNSKENILIYKGVLR